MAIRISRNDAGNCINFIGSTQPAYWNACLSGQVNEEDGTLVDVINNIRSIEQGVTEFEFYAVPYTDFEDKDGNAFADATECSEYITANCNVAANTGQFSLGPNDTLDFQLDPTNTTVLIDNGDNFAANSIVAAANDAGYIDILKHSSDIIIYGNLRLANASIHGVQVTQVLATAVNELNALFAQTGGVSGTAPVITSPLAISLTVGDSLNYLLTATNGVGYEWSNLPSGVVTAEGNLRNLLGGTALTAGTYNLSAKAVNYFGEDTETVVLTVSNPAFSDTKSIQFENQQYLGATASLLSSTLGRTSNGAGSGDAWSIQAWIKPSTSGNNNQTVFYFGDSDAANGGRIDLKFRGSDDSLRFQYGSDNNNLQYDTPASAVTAGTWHHILLTYDGGTTGSASGSVSDYYSRFTLYIDGVDVSTSTGTWSNSNFGWSSGIDSDNLRVGRSTGGQYLRNEFKVDELAVWSTDESANVATIYNTGSTQDLSLLASAPAHWWRMGDGDTFPTIQDNVGSADFTMFNMTAADIVTDTP